MPIVQFSHAQVSYPARTTLDQPCPSPKVVVSMEDVLLRIVEVSRSLRTTTSCASFATDFVSISSPPLIFPPFPQVFSELHSAGLSDQAANKLVDLFDTKCTQLQAVHQEKLIKMQSQSSPATHELLRSYFQKTYLNTVAHFHSELLHSVTQHCSKIMTPSKLSKASKGPFNQDYVPVLEKYFEYNAYPSAADRALMARKSMMTERQIEVWFQNHRNRARKEGKTLPRLRSNDPLPPSLTLDSLGTQLGDLYRPQGERQVFSSSDESEPEHFEILDEEACAPSIAQFLPKPTSNPLNPPAPSSSSPSISFLDAITSKSTFRSTVPSPNWPRRSSVRSVRPSNTSAHGIDELVDLFARLTVREGPRKQIRMSSRSTKCDRSKPPSLSLSNYLDGHTKAATCAFTTVLHPGRHPAFVTTPNTSEPMNSLPRPPSILLSTLRTSSSTSWPSAYIGQNSISRSTQPASATSSVTNIAPSISSPRPHMPSSLTPPNQSSALHRRKKLSQLPIRVPSSSPVSHSRSYHPYPTNSRVSSVASLSSTSSTTSSASSSPLTTPVHETSSLPIMPGVPSEAHSSVTTNSTPPPSRANLHNDQLIFAKTSVSTLPNHIDLYGGSLSPMGTDHFLVLPHSSSFNFSMGFRPC